MIYEVSSQGTASDMFDHTQTKKEKSQNIIVLTIFEGKLSYSF